MAKTEMIRARTEFTLKQDVETIFEKLGLSSSEAINIFFRQVKLWKGLPFDVRIPRDETIEALDDVRQKKHLRSAKNSAGLFKTLGI